MTDTAKTATVLRGRYFIAGTDTDVGKTYSSCYLLTQARRAGLSAVGVKPVAAGAQCNGGVLQNDDAIRLMAASSIALAYSEVNPCCLSAACSPHIAAARANVSLRACDIVQKIQQVLQKTNTADLQLVEGAGGWLVPINAAETMADIALQLNLPVILVVGMKLGCINHALLTADVIKRSGLPLAGWVANSLGNKMAFYEENVATLAAQLGAPLYEL